MTNTTHVCVHHSTPLPALHLIFVRSRTVCIYNTLECLFIARTPLRETLPLLATLRKSAQESEEIWGRSNFADAGGRRRIELFLKFEKNAQALLTTKKGWLDEDLVPGSDFGDVLVEA